MDPECFKCFPIKSDEANYEAILRKSEFYMHIETTEPQDIYSHY